MTTNSWETLRRKLAPNPQQHKAWPIMIRAMAATVGGTALVVGALIMLFGITDLPETFADLTNPQTWRLLLDIACLYTTWLVISNGNNFFGLHRPAGYTWTISGALALVAVARDLALTALNFPVTAEILRDPTTAVLTLGTLLAGALLLRVGNRWFARSRRHLVEIVPHPRDLRGLDYCLYLRTFEQDDALAGPQRFSRPKRLLRSAVLVEPPEEGLVADALSADTVPLIAVGGPGQPAPHVGALRVYLPDADWQPQVRELITGARHVVVLLGWGEGTRWELSEAMRILEPAQLILVVPMEEADYERFRRDTAGELPAALPAYAGHGSLRCDVRGLITFSEDWSPRFVPVRSYSPFHNSLRIALLFAAWPALRRLGYPPRGVLRLAPNTLN